MPSFQLATPDHDAGIRQLLRESAMAGNIAISLQREPSYFESLGREGGEHHTIVAIDAGNVVCMGNIAVRERYYNGEPRRVGYLGQLRLAASHAGRFDVVRRGYRFFREFHDTLRHPSTSPASRPTTPRRSRFSNAGCPACRAHEFVGELRTAVVRVRSAYEAVNISGSPILRAIVENKAFQFAPVWALRDADVDDLFVIRCGDRMASAALWDQRPFKQVVVSGYASRVARWRPLITTSMQGSWAGFPCRGPVMCCPRRSSVTLRPMSRIPMIWFD